MLGICLSTLIFFTACQSKEQNNGSSALESDLHSDISSDNIRNFNQIVIKQTQQATLTSTEDIQKVIVAIDEGVLLKEKPIFATGAVPYNLELEQIDGTIEKYIVHSDVFGKVISDDKTIWYSSDLGNLLDEMFITTEP